jgi:CubicO group peptidase (beta-lactamase class C family)
MSSERVRHIARLAEGWVSRGITPSLVVLAARKGVVVLHEAFGKLTPESDSPPLPLDAIFPLASITKPITATAAMILVEDGLLGLNRPVREYVPEFVGEGKDAVMVHHLLTHTSGLREEDVEAYARSFVGSGLPFYDGHDPVFDHVSDGPYVRYFDRLYDVPRHEPPGIEMSYCGYGYDVLAEIVRRVSGISLARFAKERIFDRLGLIDTSYGLRQATRHRYVQRPAYAIHVEGVRATELLEKPYGCTSVYSTASDLATFGQMFLNRGRHGGERIVSAASVAEMTRNQIPGTPARYGIELFSEGGWGFGWELQLDKKTLYRPTLSSPRSFGHGGAGGVFLWIDPANETVIVYLSIALEYLRGTAERRWADLFVNAVTAAIEDE